MPQGDFEVIIIGGGILGAGLARDLALRGVSVCVLEKRDFGSGTTSGSTRLVHGGLRYLEMLDFGLVRMDLRERETLLRIAPHLVKPLPFLVPFLNASLWFRAKLRAGMLLYDLLSYGKSLPNHRSVDARGAAEAEPALRQEGLQGGEIYYDAQVALPERLCLENLLDAEAHGASIHSYCEAGAVGPTANGAFEVRTPEGKVSGRVVVNATGAWADRVLPPSAPRLRTTKGIHITCGRMVNQANVLFSPIDGRLFFVIPLFGNTWIGTTDTDFDGDPANARATGADVEYLLRSVEPFFPRVRTLPIYSTNAGVRALVRQGGSESSVSRVHKIEETSDGLFTLLGGKITGYRAIAEEAADRIAERLGNREKCTTARRLLPGATAESPAGLSREHVEYCVKHEHCRHLADYLLRRTSHAFDPDQGRCAAASALEWMAAALGWSREESATELSRYEGEIDLTQMFRGELP